MPMMILNVILFLVGFLRTLFFVVVFYYLLKFLIKLLAPLFGYQAVNKNRENRKRKEVRPEGDVRVEDSQERKPHIRNDEGEYVDFEEVD